MRLVPMFLVLVVVPTVTSACGSGAPGSGTPSPAATQSFVGTQPPASTPAAGGANTLSYEIAGEYSASGEATFDAERSIYDESGNGWIAYFADETGTINLRVSTRPGEESIEFSDGEYVVRGDTFAQSGNVCTFDITKNDASGPVGRVVCERAVVHPNGATYVDLSAEWDVSL